MAISKHGGNVKQLASLAGASREEILDFSASINPLGLPEWFRAVVNSCLDSVMNYPDPDSLDLVQAAAEKFGCSHDQVLVGNGSSELLYHLPRTLKKARAVILAPTYVDYAAAVQASGIRPTYVLLRESDNFCPDWESLAASVTTDSVVFLCNPNNPTGTILDAQKLRELALAHPSAVFVIDEAFADFVDGMDSITVNRPTNVVVLLSLTKIFAIPGLRLGLAIADAGIVRSTRDLLPPWSVNCLAQAVGPFALRDAAYVERSRSFVREQRAHLLEELAAIPGLRVYSSEANFLLVRIAREGLDARDLAKRLLGQRIAIRVCNDFQGLDSRFFRVAVRTREENDRLCDALREVFAVARKRKPKSPPPALMFQGTSSNAGKSLLTAAFCRILLQDGYKVAPFKAQNMSLNSFVTSTGGEIGRAQALQAQACRLAPDVRMNPLLLKPTSATGTQVIVLGEPVGNMQVKEYIRYKPQVIAAVRSAYDSLSADFDVMVIEGAGSPAEMNLKHHDIVNMQMARYAQAHVLIVGDIDRGGVFASFIGTMDVLEPWERAMTKGFVINRFRGDETLLKPAIDYTELHTGRPTLGVVPYLENLGLPEEDSVTFKDSRYADEKEMKDCVEIALIDLPHISNFTDFDALRQEPDVKLTIVRTVEDLVKPDAIILPGTKNTIEDLRYVTSNGIGWRVAELAEEGVEIVGICGGFQMLGSEIADPHGLESGVGSFAGLKLLDVTTVLAPEKTLKQVSGTHLESNLAVVGYEIHHGKSDHANARPVVKLSGGGMDGTSSRDRKIWGTYLHGIFDSDEFRRWFIDKLRKRRGLKPLGRICHRYEVETALDRLAETVRRCVDIHRIYRIMGLR